jgi:acyl dehydratase
VSSGASSLRFPLPAGEELPTTRRQLTQEVISGYAEASGDRNPIHLDPGYAARAGLDSTIAHGLLTLGVACSGVEAFAQGSAYVSLVSCRFSAPVPSGQEIACAARVAGSDSETALIELDVLTASGERALTRAKVQLRRL